MATVLKQPDRPTTKEYFDYDKNRFGRNKAGEAKRDMLASFLKEKGIITDKEAAKLASSNEVESHKAIAIAIERGIKKLHEQHPELGEFKGNFAKESAGLNTHLDLLKKYLKGEHRYVLLVHASNIQVSKGSKRSICFGQATQMLDALAKLIKEPPKPIVEKPIVIPQEISIPRVTVPDFAKRQVTRVEGCPAPMSPEELKPGKDPNRARIVNKQSVPTIVGVPFDIGDELQKCLDGCFTGTDPVRTP